MPFAIGIAALAAAVVLLFHSVHPLSASLLLFGDSLASASRWIGVTRPSVGWLLLGLLGGAITGVFVGMRRSGMSFTPRRLGGTLGALGVALLVSGSRAPSPNTRPIVDRESNSTPSAPRRTMFVASAKRLSVRSSPASRSVVVGRLAPHTALDVLRGSSDGQWSYVEAGRGSRRVSGWVPRSALSDQLPDLSRSQVADNAPGDNTLANKASADNPSTEVQQSVGGEVTLSPRASSARVADSATTSAGPSRVPAAPAAAPVPPPAPAPGTGGESSKPSGSLGGFGGRVEEPDRAAIAEVRGTLETARVRAAAGNFAGALQALTAADESVDLAAAKTRDTGWIATLRRTVASARADIRGTCTSAAAAATSRGETPPRCE